MTHHRFISVLLFQEQPGVWVAQGLEHDIAAHGDSIQQAKVAFERTVLGYFRLAAKHHQEPLASLKAAPDPFWDAWKRVSHKETEPLSADESGVPPAYVVQAITTESLATIH